MRLGLTILIVRYTLDPSRLKSFRIMPNLSFFKRNRYGEFGEVGMPSAVRPQPLQKSRVRQVEGCWLVAASATTATAASATAVSSTTTTASATTALHLRTGFVDVERAAAHLGAVQSGDSFVAFFRVSHFHETESAGTPRITIGHDADPVDLPMRLEHLPQLFF